MADRRKSARHRQETAFRDSFLLHLQTQPGLADAFRLVGHELYGWMLEYVRLYPENGQSATRRDVRAALADLRHVEGFLQY